MHRTVTVWAQAWRMVLESASRRTATKQFATFAGACSVITSSSICGPLSEALAPSTMRSSCTERSTALSLSAWTLVRTSWSASSTVRLTSAEIGSDAGLVGVDRARASACSEARVSWCPTLSWISRAMRARSAKRRELDFVVLAVSKIAVARFEHEGSFLQLVADTVHALLLALQLGGT